MSVPRSTPTRLRNVLVPMLVGGSILAGTCAFGQSPPPRDLRQTGDHWTAWNPPTPPEGAQVHVIQPGETLWSIAGSLLGDPYLWPQIWEANQYILDAHWIYPGDPLVISAVTAGVAPGDGVVGEPLDQADPADYADGTMPGSDDPFDSLLGEDGEGEGFWDPSFADSGSGAPVPLGFEADIYCTGYIGEVDEAFPYTIAGSEYEFLTPTLDPRRDSEIKGIWGKSDTQKYGLSNGDIVYLDGGRADGLTPGELLTAVLPKDKVRHPLTGKMLGRMYAYLGRLRVLSVQDESSIGEIIRTCDPIPVGSTLKLFEPEPVPLRRRTPMRPVNLPAANEQLEDAPVIIASYDNVVAMGGGYLLFIDQGEEQDVLPGDIFTVYRRGRRGYPPIVLGELGILSVRENTALGRLLDARYTVYVGDVLMIK
ncbi:MAG: LysM peptidoglycan-binding domain-containing protein [Holophagales bacterium]|nr:LysM peptidoglycan-binding domain-containing protein [Holophagales bacterium]